MIYANLELHSFQNKIILMSGQTFIYDTKDKRVYVGNLGPTAQTTAHERLVKQTQLSSNKCKLIGGSIKSNGDIQYRSESINAQCHRQCDMSSSKLAPIIKQNIQSSRTTNFMFVKPKAWGYMF